MKRFAPKPRFGVSSIKLYLFWDNVHFYYPWLSLKLNSKIKGFPIIYTYSLTQNVVNFKFELAGADGFEPSHEGVKVPCLTAWLHPYKGKERGSGLYSRSRSFCGVGKGTRTLDTRNHNPVL